MKISLLAGGAIAKLKSIVRFFKLHGIRGSGVLLSGRRAQLVARVVLLLKQYIAVAH